MGTHPIFESDFDCLTEIMSKSVRTTIRTTSVSEDGSVKLRKTPKPHDAVIICVSSRALFDIREGDRLRGENGLDYYIKWMVDNENKPLCPGPAFGFIQAIES